MVTGSLNENVTGVFAPADPAQAKANTSVRNVFRAIGMLLMRAVGTQIHQPDAGEPRRGTFFVESGKNKPYRTRAELVNRYRSAMSQANELTKLVHRELGRSDVH